VSKATVDPLIIQYVYRRGRARETSPAKTISQCASVPFDVHVTPGRHCIATNGGLQINLSNSRRAYLTNIDMPQGCNTLKGIT
jgi:hypothetical protein